MSHLTMDALLALREDGAEPGTAAARQHVEECAQCRAEFERLHQRVARLKALPALRPARDMWPAVRARDVRERRGWRTRWIGVAGLLAAASIALTVIGGGLARPAEADAAAQIEAARQRSRLLEGALNAYNPDVRVIDGRTARMSQVLEDRIAALDRQLQAAELRSVRSRKDAQQERMLELWRERVGLLDALVDVHVTRASNVGL